jgi:putative transposase
MDGRRSPINIFTERLWRSLKYEDIEIKKYRSPWEARTGIENYFRFYNEERPHQNLNDKTPLEIYKISLNVKDTERLNEADSALNQLC